MRMIEPFLKDTNSVSEFVKTFIFSSFFEFGSKFSRREEYWDQHAAYHNEVNFIFPPMSTS